jgi:hypothetical protein
MKNRCLRFLRPFLALLAMWPAACMAQTALEEKVQAIDSTFFKARAAACTAYRKSMAELFANADKIEVFLLDFEMADAGEYRILGWDRLPEGFFPIQPYDKKSKILKRKTLSADEVAKLLPALRANVGAEENHGGAFCHYPIHAVRLWSGERIMFQSSFCWACLNFYVAFPDGTTNWVGVTGKDLEKVMTELMPIPEKELERFRRKNEPKPKKKKK